MTIRIGLMGFGRIGRNVFRIVHDRDDVEVAAIVDIAEPPALEYLLRFDTVHGRFEDPVWVKGIRSTPRGARSSCSRRRAPGDVDWAALGVDIVVEATGQYRTRAILQKHLDRGAKCVVLTVPPRDEIDALVVMGVNDHVLGQEHAHRQQRVVHRQRAGADLQDPRRRVRDRARLHDDGARLHERPAPGGRASHRDAPLPRRRREHHPDRDALAEGRAVDPPAACGKLDGMALNVPVPDGSNVDLVTLMKRDVTAEEVNEIVKSASLTTFKGIVEYTDQPIVSSDVVGQRSLGGVRRALHVRAGRQHVEDDHLVRQRMGLRDARGRADRPPRVASRRAGGGEVVMAKPRVAINGFGRIGRAAFRLLSQRDDIEVVAINDVTPNETLAYLTRFDTVYGRYPGRRHAEGRHDDRRGRRSVRMLEQKDPRSSRGASSAIDVVVEATGRFRKREECAWHLQAGAKRVILTVPAKDEVDAMVVVGVNDHLLRPEHRIVSNASCTTNCLAPGRQGPERRLRDRQGRDHDRARLHQRPAPGGRAAQGPAPLPRRQREHHPDDDRRRAGGRQGAPRAQRQARRRRDARPRARRLDRRSRGRAVEKPSRSRRSTAPMKEAASKAPLQGILAYCEEPIVSSDIIQDSHSATFDSLCTRVLGGNFVKVHRLVRQRVGVFLPGRRPDREVGGALRKGTLPLTEDMSLRKKRCPLRQ